MVNGLVAPDAVYFTSPDDGICWLRVINEGASAMEFDSADELFAGHVLTSGGMLSMEELQQKPELMLELPESDRALVAAFDLSESRRPRQTRRLDVRARPMLLWRGGLRIRNRV